MDTKILSTSEYDIQTAGRILAEGGLVAFPTETVYGLGANALDDDAVKNIYTAKGRPSDNPLIVHIADKKDIAPMVKKITPKAQQLIDAFFPNALTIILPKSDKIGKTVSGGLDTVAIRMPKNETARRVISASGCPIAAPSANTSGLPSPTKSRHVIADMMGKIDAVIDGGDCEYGVESTVITLVPETPVILRPGAVTKEMIEAVIGRVEVAKAVLEGMKNDEVAESPGMKYKHYAPKAKVIIVDADKETYESFVNSQKNAFALCFEEDKVTVPKVTFGRENDDSSQARELFDALRKLDEMGAEKVYARIPHTTGVGMAVYNRLIRSAAFKIIDLNKPFFIGLTGPTGAGKGFAGEYLKTIGFNIIDCDKIVKDIYENNSPLVNRLAEEFGSEILLENGKINRKALAKLAFSSDENKNRLNSIVHPAVIEECEKKAKGLSVLDAPQLFEAGAQSRCYKIISVIADRETRIERIIKRDHITREQALERIHAQYDDAFYISHSDFVIYNNGENIENQIENILEEIL